MLTFLLSRSKVTEQSEWPSGTRTKQQSAAGMLLSHVSLFCLLSPHFLNVDRVMASPEHISFNRSVFMKHFKVTRESSLHTYIWTYFHIRQEVTTLSSDVWLLEVTGRYR